MNEILGYHFKNHLLLKEALTHPSVCVRNNSKAPITISYERLEFLGDAALSLVIAELLMLQFPDENEGKLAKRRSGLVVGEVLAKIAHNMNLGERIKMTEAEHRLGGRENSNNLENVLEAIIGAIYLDSGLEELKKIITKIWQPFIDNMLEVPNDPKSQLQEILQKNGKKLPIYELIESKGPGHMLTFKISLKVPGFNEVIAEGKSKQQAEKEAATMLLEQITNI